MNELRERISFLNDEIDKCVALSSAAAGLAASLGKIGTNLSSCGSSLSAGGFIIGGVAVDVAEFGGFKDWTANNVTSIETSLSNLIASINTALITYSQERTSCQYRLDQMVSEARDRQRAAAVAETSNKVYTPRYVDTISDRRRVQ